MRHARWCTFRMARKARFSIDTPDSIGLVRISRYVRNLEGIEVFLVLGSSSGVKEVRL